MPRSVPIVLAVAFFAAGTSAQQPLLSIAAKDATSGFARVNLVGVWKISELAWRTPGAEWDIRPTPQVSQYIFTGKHYSYMYVPGTAARKLFAGDPNRPTDAEKVEAYNSFVGGSGTYTLSAGVLTLRALVHKNPNEMTGKPLTYAVEFGGSTLRMVIADPPFLPGRESRTTLTRVE